ncbi:MAG: uracil phosphoribosyltransferase [Deltaproteobacteria bacterium]|nr:uracil phosphoribosyltransferase [Deltaproteobacteria bacterium]
MNPPCILAEEDHAYGSQVHILADPYLRSLLARACVPETVQPEMNRLISACYEGLVRAALVKEFPRTRIDWPTRMAASEPRAVLRHEIIDRRTRTITVNVARAGTLPSQVAFDVLHTVIDPELIRQDHVVMNRVTDEKGQVTGTSVHGSKIGGGVEGAMVLFPDPMAATGGSMARAIDIYQNEVEGTPRGLVALHLIVTPEYLKKITGLHPEVPIYALRLDRGLSPEDVLACRPGERWDEERGLDDRQYIVPGGGGFGELMNNAEF